MGHIPNEIVDDGVPELGVRRNNALPGPRGIGEHPEIPPFLNRLLNGLENQRFVPEIQELHFLNPPHVNLRWNFQLPAAILYPQPHFPRGRTLRPPPIGVRIPIIHRAYEASSEEFRVGVLYRARSLPLRCAVNRPFSDRRRRVRENIPPPTMPQLRFQKQPTTQVCLRKLSSQQLQIRGSKSPATTSPRSSNKSSNCNHHPRGGRPQPFHLTTQRRLSRSRLRRCGCKMNRVDLEMMMFDNDQEVFEEEEEEEEDNDDHKCNKCEAYKDLYDSDDDDYGDDNAFPNMQLLC